MLGTFAIILMASLYPGPAQSPTVLLPFDKTVDPNWMVVFKVGVNGKGPFSCLFDTGANAVVVSPDLVAELGIKPGNATSVAPWQRNKVGSGNLPDPEEPPVRG